MDLVGDLAGVFELFISVLAIIMVPLAKHSFTLEALNDNYKIDKNKNSVVDYTKLRLAKKHAVAEEEEENIEDYEISFCDNIKLFWNENALDSC